MQGCSANIVSSVHLGPEGQDLPQLLGVARRSDMHQYSYTAIDYWVIHRESTLHDVHAWLHVPLANRAYHGLLRAVYK